jgi:uncharacterized membrane protein
MESDDGGYFNPKHIIIFAICLIVFLFLIAAIHFRNTSFDECIAEGFPANCKEASSWSDYRAAWGQFGDFIGGILNPILSFLTICLLVMTIRQQNAAIRQTESALNQAGQSLGHAEAALKQNEEALRITRDEIQIAREEIKIGREIQKQTEESLNKQIEISRQQNNFSNYYKHLELFEQYAGVQIGKYHYVEKVKIRLLYLVIYPRSKNGSYEWSRSLVEMVIKQNISLLIRVATYIEDRNANTLIYDLSILVSNSLQITRSRLRFSVELKEANSKTLNLYKKDNPEENKEGFKFYNRSLNESIYALIEVHSVINEVLGFDPDCVGLFDASEKTLRAIAALIPRIESYSPITFDEHEWMGFCRQLKKEITAIKNTQDFLEQWMLWLNKKDILENKLVL